MSKPTTTNDYLSTNLDSIPACIIKIDQNGNATIHSISNTNTTDAPPKTIETK